MDLGLGVLEEVKGREVRLKRERDRSAESGRARVVVKDEEDGDGDEDGDLLGALLGGEVGRRRVVTPEGRERERKRRRVGIEVL